MKYRCKPVVLEAERFLGDLQSLEEIERLIGKEFTPKEIAEIVTSDTIMLKSGANVEVVSLGDYVVKGIKGDCHPCRPDIFHELYNPVMEG